MPLITPAILTESFDEFVAQVRRYEPFFSYAQIDVMDGKFVPSVSFPERIEINDIGTGLRFELHLMVNDPYNELLRWGNVRNVSRVLFHAEAPDEPAKVIEEVRARGLEVGVVLNPETPISVIESYVGELDVVQFMTVHPGRQGAPFVPEVGEKIRAFASRPRRPRVSVDGGVSPTTIGELTRWGAEIVNVGGFFTKAADIPLALLELRKILKNPNS